MLVVEDSVGSRAWAVFCRTEPKGVGMTLGLNLKMKVEALYDQMRERFGFRGSYAAGEDANA